MFQWILTLEVGCTTVARRTEVRLVVMLLDVEVWILCAFTGLMMCILDLIWNSEKCCMIFDILLSA
jgi:hypothetical protein